MVVDHELAALEPSTGLDRLLAAAGHAGGLAVVGLGWFPALVWLFAPMVSTTPAYLRHQALQALLFHLLSFVVGSGLWGLATLFFYGSALIITAPVFLPLAGLFGLAAGVFTVWAAVIMVIATVLAVQGKPYRMPMVGRIGTN